MLAGAARVDITPPFPVDLQGYVRRDIAARAAAAGLSVTACVLIDDVTTIALLGADLANLTPDYAVGVRQTVADAIGCAPDDVLLNSSHTHAAPWPGQAWKISGEFLDRWLPTEETYFRWLPSAYATAALEAFARAAPARVSGGVGAARGIAVNRRERNPDPLATALTRTVLGWNPGGFVDEDVPTLRIDGLDGRRIATVVAFGCHPCVIGPDVPLAGPDFVGPLRDVVEQSDGGLCLYLAGAGGNVLPLEGWHDRLGPEVQFGRRVGIEAVRAVADANPWVTTVDRHEYRSLVPIAFYRRRVSESQPAQPLRVVSRTVAAPVLEPAPTAELEAELSKRRSDLVTERQRGSNGSVTNPIEVHIRWLAESIEALAGRTIPRTRPAQVWAMRVGDCAVVGAPGEIFSEIGYAVRSQSPAAVTLFAGYCGGCLGYVPTRAEYEWGGYEPCMSHRNYGQPAGLAPEAGELILDTALQLLADLFDGSRTLSASPRAASQS